MGFETCKRLAGKRNSAGSGGQETAQKVETGRLPSAIWTNESDNVPFLHGKVDTIDRGESAKVPRQVLRFQ
jgi:hypothetical protein